MNKYQKALDYLAENSMYETVERRGREIWKEVTHEGIEAQELLQELVDKATPKRPKISKINEKLTLYYCPECGTYVGSRAKYYLYRSDVDNYCSYCGQTIKQDWND